MSKLSKNTKYYNPALILPLYEKYSVDRSIETRNQLLLLLLPFLEGALQAHYKYLLYYPSDQYEDLRQGLFIHLIKGLDTYDKTKGTSLYTWLTSTIHGAILNEYTGSKNRETKKRKIQAAVIDKSKEDIITPSFLNFFSYIDEIEIDFTTWSSSDIYILHTLRDIAGRADTEELLTLSNDPALSLSVSLKELRSFKKKVRANNIYSEE